VTSAN